MVIAAAATISKPGPAAVRRAGQPAQDAVQRRVPLLHAPATSCPRPTTSRWTRASPTPTDSGLDRRLASADIAILSTIWDDWSEPNDSRKVGLRQGRAGARRATSATSARYLDLYELYQKCH